MSGGEFQLDPCIIQRSIAYLKIHKTKRKAGKLGQRHWEARKQFYKSIAC